MSEKIQAVRGMNDILPIYTLDWQKLEEILRKLAQRYGYDEVRLPLLEKTELFERCIGNMTDIIEKEMYTFIDRNHSRLSLRPEGTAGCVRAGIEGGLFRNDQVHRWWYLGPMFRHERPQKGRYRQFHQFGIEVFGIEQPYADAELILMTAGLWSELGLQNKLRLHINSLGSLEARKAHREKLVAYFEQKFIRLDEDSKRRLPVNPLRILDSKNPDMQALIREAPPLLSFLDEDSQRNFSILKDTLQQAGIDFVINPRLVRGLDYYNDTVFEWMMVEESGAQNTLCAGGRYDSLVRQLGGPPTPAVGFAIGLERLIRLFAESNLTQKKPVLDVYLALIGEEYQVRQVGLMLADRLRKALPHMSLLVDWKTRSTKNIFKQADKSSARFALILGKNEVESNSVTLKYLREEKPQEMIRRDKILEKLQECLSHG